MKKSILIACVLFLVVVGVAHADFDRPDPRCSYMEYFTNWYTITSGLIPIQKSDTMVVWFKEQGALVTEKRNGQINFVGTYAKHCLNMKYFEWREGYEGKIMKRVDLTKLDLPLVSMETALEFEEKMRQKRVNRALEREAKKEQERQEEI
jgi:hypothetical protein